MLRLGKEEIRVEIKSSGKNDQVEPIVRSEIVNEKSRFGPGAKVNIRGARLAGISQTGARLINQREITRILRVGNCITCHDKYNDRIYRNIKRSYAFEKKPAHRKLIANFLNKGTSRN